MTYYDKALMIDKAVEKCKFYVHCSTDAGSINSKNIVTVNMHAKNKEVFLKHLLSANANVDYDWQLDNDGWVIFSI